MRSRCAIARSRTTPPAKLWSLGRKVSDETPFRPKSSAKRVGLPVAIGGVMSTAMTLLQGLPVPPRVARAHAMKNCLTIILAASHLVLGEIAGEARDRVLR